MFDSTPSGAAAGLVHSSTTGTRGYPLDSRLARFRRMRHGVITGARLMSEMLSEGGHRYKAAMVTLTYADIYGWRPEHVKQCLQHFRKYAQRRGYKLHYVWVMELQKRGAPHYHVLLWLPRGLTFPKPDKRGWWTHGSTKIEWARNAVGYLANYASKDNIDCVFPKGARIHGFGGLAPAQMRERRWWLRPKWVRERFTIEEDPRIVPGGGYASGTTGEFAPSPYKVFFFNGVLVAMKVEHYEQLSAGRSNGRCPKNPQG